MDWSYGMHVKQESSIWGLVGWSEGKRPLRRFGCKFKDNIKMVVKEVGLGGMGWIDLNEDRDRLWVLVNAVMKFQVPKNAGNLSTTRDLVNFPRRIMHFGVMSDRLCLNN